MTQSHNRPKAIALALLLTTDPLMAHERPCLTAAMAAPPADEGAVRNGHDAKEALLIGTWRLTGGPEMPANLQPRFAADVYIEVLEFMPGGKLRVRRARGHGESLGTWEYVAEGRNEPGSLRLVYPHWRRSGVNNDRLVHLDKLTPDAMTILALADVPIELEKHEDNDPKGAEPQRLERIHAELKGMQAGEMAALITRAAGGKEPDQEKIHELVITLPSGMKTTVEEMHRASALGLKEKLADQPGLKRAMLVMEGLSRTEEQDTQHPLVCGPARDFPEGSELLFTQAATRTKVHVVFPNKEAAPKTTDGNFTIRGYYRGIRNQHSYKQKRPGSNYRYFVATSWERQPAK